MVKLQNSIVFDGGKSCDKFDGYICMNKEVLFDKPIHLAFVILDLSKRYIYETYFNTLQLFFDPNPERNIHFPYMNCNLFVMSIEKNDLLKDLTKLQEGKDLSDFQKKC